MSLSAILDKTASDIFRDDQGPWRQFILDHLDFIANKSQTMTIEPEVMNLYRYDFDRFLRDKMQRTLQIGWIVRLVNYITSDLEFDATKTIIVPTDALISSLYQVYASVNANPIR